MTRPRLLIVDDDRAVTSTLAPLLRDLADVDTVTHLLPFIMVIESDKTSVLGAQFSDFIFVIFVIFVVFLIFMTVTRVNGKNI